MNPQLLADIDARHRLTPEEEAVLDAVGALVERIDKLPDDVFPIIDVLPVIEYDDLAHAWKALKEAEGRG